MRKWLLSAPLTFYKAILVSHEVANLDYIHCHIVLHYLRSLLGGYLYWIHVNKRPKFEDSVCSHCGRVV